MSIQRQSMSLLFAFAAASWGRSSFATVEGTAGVPQREPLVGVGFHPGNFVGPLAFDVIMRPLPHVDFDVQVGYSTAVDGRVHGLAFVPALQWEWFRRWQTPYVGLAFRFEKN